MSERGVFAVDRGLWNDPDFPNEPFSEREAWLWLVSEAAWRKTEVRIGSHKIELERGQCAFSTRFMAAKFQWSESRVRRFLKRREALGQVSLKTDAAATRVTICKYDSFQRVGTVGDAPATQERRTSDAPATQRRNRETSKQGNTPTEPIGSSGEPAPDDEQVAYEAWNALAARCGLPIAKALTRERRSRLKERLLQVGGLDGWLEALKRVEASPFLTGRKTDFRADLDFLLQFKSFTRLIEGSYDDNGKVYHGQFKPRESNADAFTREFEARYPGSTSGARVVGGGH